jgi:3-hydroxyisobutyrate dehydrogenase
VSAACKDATKVATPLLQSMGRRVVVVSTDDPGAAQAAKLANQIALAAQMAGVAEALAYGVGQGLTAERVTSVLLASTGRSWSSEVNSPAPGVVATAPASRGYAGGFAVRLMAKDLQAARDSAPPGVPMPMSEATAALFEAASGAGGGDLDFSCIYKLVYGMDGEAEAGKGGERVA